MVTYGAKYADRVDHAFPQTPHVESHVDLNAFQDAMDAGVLQTLKNYQEFCEKFDSLYQVLANNLSKGQKVAMMMGMLNSIHYVFNSIL